MGDGGYTRIPSKKNKRTPYSLLGYKITFMVDYIFFNWTSSPPRGSKRYVESGYLIKGIHNDEIFQSHRQLGGVREVFIGKSPKLIKEFKPC